MSILEKVNKHKFNRTSDDFEPDLQELIATAHRFHLNAEYLKSGLLFLELKNLAWGHNDEILFNCIKDSIINLELAVQQSADEPIKGILSLHLLSQALSDIFRFIKNNQELKDSQLKVNEELAERLIITAKHSDYRNTILALGLQISYDFSKGVELLYPEEKVSGNSKSYGGDKIVFNISSAFEIFIEISDFEGAQFITIEFPYFFENPEGQGWVNAIRGWLEPESAHLHFSKASEEFAKDTNEYYQKNEKNKGYWSSVNIDLWSPYYKSLSYLSFAKAQPEKAEEFILKASEAIPQLHYLNSKVSRYKALINAISDGISDEDGFDVLETLKDYQTAIRLTGEELKDKDAIEFIQNLKIVLEGFKINPKKEIVSSRMVHLIKQLDDLPQFQEGMSKGIREALGSKALDLCQGPSSWFYRKLESIPDEDILRKVLLRLFQSLSPDYAQIVHGVVEHGKDILRVIEIDGNKVLELYQIKVGDIGTPEWREMKPQLEETFEVVPPDILDLGETEYKKVTFLAFNGHVKPIAEPKVSGWKKLQKDKFNHDYEIMHIDSIVQFIIKNRLMNEFRKCIKEYKF